jgi:hypothetical protein
MKSILLMLSLCLFAYSQVPTLMMRGNYTVTAFSFSRLSSRRIDLSLCATLPKDSFDMTWHYSDISTCMCKCIPAIFLNSPRLFYRSRNRMNLSPTILDTVYSRIKDTTMFLQYDSLHSFYCSLFEGHAEYYGQNASPDSLSQYLYVFQAPVKPIPMNPYWKFAIVKIVKAFTRSYSEVFYGIPCVSTVIDSIQICYFRDDMDPRLLIPTQVTTNSRVTGNKAVHTKLENYYLANGRKIRNNPSSNSIQVKPGLVVLPGHLINK